MPAPVAAALRVARRVRAALRVNGRRPRGTVLAGSLARLRPGRPARGAARDVDIIVVVRDRDVRARVDVALPGVRHRRRSGGARHAVVVVGGLPVDLFFVTRRELPFARFHWTGPRAYNVRTRRLARLRGLKLNQYGLWRGGRRVRGLRSERDIARAIGVSFREPWRR